MQLEILEFSMSDQYVRLYLTPSNGTQQVIDVDVDHLILSDGVFVSPQTAKSVTLSGAPVSASFTPFGFAPVDQALETAYQDEIRICWREPVGTDDYPNENVVVSTDPSGGNCVCGVTCLGPNLSYVVVKSVTETLGY
jgi:hypothetical protein